MENDQVFTSWKEIAAHFGKGVRTVQRWEEQLGLPVRRRGGSGTGIVVALRGELDEWLRSKMQVRPQHMNGIDSEELQHLISGLQAKIQQLKGEIENLRSKKEAASKGTELNRRVNEAGLAFLKTEIATAIMFAEIALHSSGNVDQRGRNSRYARKAYDTVLYFSQRLALSEAAALELDKDLIELKAVLLELGESF